MMDVIVSFIENNEATVVLGLLVFSLILFVISITALVKASSANKRYKSFLTGYDGINVEELLKSNAIKLQDLGSESNILKQEIKKIENQLAFAVQCVGIVKYDAFDNVGNKLSFSLALLDKFKNGVIITSIYGRDFTTLYGKPITYGKSDYQLSDEELEAVDRALKGEFKEKHL